jgi:Homeodomain-like domain
MVKINVLCAASVQRADIIGLGHRLTDALSVAAVSRAMACTPQIAQTLSCGIATVYNDNRRYLTEGLESALSDKARSGRPQRIDGRARAKITALACSAAPAVHARWRGWLGRAAKSGLPEFQSFVVGLQRDAKAVEAALSYEWSQGQVEGKSISSN